MTRTVIVGAGPVGLMLACELRRAGAPVVIIERLASPMTQSRASQLSALTAELLYERGFDSLLDEAVREPKAHFGGLPFELSDAASDHWGNWKVPQYRTEEALWQRASELGAKLLRAHELIDLTTEGDHVVCRVRAGSDDVSIRAKYVVGCDGADSSVRRLAGFTSSGTAATKELLRADVVGLEIPDRRFERLDAGFAAASTRAGVTRVMVHAVGQPVAERTSSPEFSEVAQLWKKVTGDDISGGKALWVDAFDNSRGQADQYRKGRVFLAGDAAHWHLPIGGQSLNVGLHDAVNLGWKLAWAVHGWAPARLLDTYHSERHPVAARVLNYVAAQEMLLLGGGEFEPLRAVMAELIELDHARGHLARVVSNTDDRYGEAPPACHPRLSNLKLRDQSGSPITAQALLGTRPVVIRLGSFPPQETPGPVALPDGFRLRAIRAVPSGSDCLRGISTLLVRPDGYLAWAGNNETELNHAIDRWFGTSDEV